jgi:hypothetical protein
LLGISFDNKENDPTASLPSSCLIRWEVDERSTVIKFTRDERVMTALRGKRVMEEERIAEDTGAMIFYLFIIIIIFNYWYDTHISSGF